MRFSKMFIHTFKEAPKDASLKSHEYLVRGGFIAQIGSGIYNFLPLGKRVLDKVKAIIKDEMDKAGAQEVALGFVTPASLWQKSGRFERYGKELLRFKDRKENDFVLGPTHEEVITELVKNSVKSYKQLPLHLYQMNLKFRDEIRPRFGLIRAREFIMKDGYSFHSSEEDLKREFDLMESTYSKIFKRLGLDFRAVEADSGAIGGSGSKEFMILAESGEDTICVCDKCNYAANLETATRKNDSHFDFLSHSKKSRSTDNKSSLAHFLEHSAQKLCVNNDFETNQAKNVESQSALTPPIANFAKFHTPGVKSIESLAVFFKTSPFYTLKAVIKKAIFDGDKCELVYFFLRGSDSLNETKALNVIGANELVDASEEEIREVGLIPGFVGPYALRNITGSNQIYFDNELKDEKNLICGANELDYHFVGVDLGTFEGLEYRDLLEVKEGDGCPKCESGKLYFTKGIEAGHIFQLGTKYSSAMEATFLDENGKAKPFIMGCYGIGVSRILAALIEQNHDKKGMIWTEATAPFKLQIIISNVKNNEQLEFGEKLYDALEAANIECLLDDRGERYGSKIADFELIGIPYGIVVGKGLESGEIELIKREGLEKITLNISDFESLKESLIKKIKCL